MQITSTSEINYIATPNFNLGIAGWTAAGGSLSYDISQSYGADIGSLKFTPSGIYGFADYPVIGMATSVPYIAQAKVMASAGQEVFIQFSNGGAIRQIATGNWDLLVTPATFQFDPSFSVQVGVGSVILINVSDSIILTENTSLLINYGLNKQNIVVSDAISTQESLSISIPTSITQSYIYDFNINVNDVINSSELIGVGNYLSPLFVSASELSVTSESYSIQGVGLFKSALNIAVSDSSSTYESFIYNVGTLGVYVSPLNLKVQDFITTTEAYQVGSFVSGSVYLISISDSVVTSESLFVRAGSSTVGAINIDQVMLEQSLTPTAYFDGDSGNGYHWAGKEDSSISYYRQFEIASNSSYATPNYGVLISWTRAFSSNYTFFTIGTSTIGGSDFIPGTSTFPTYFNQYQYGEYSTYLTGVSITKNIGQFPYGAFGAQLDLELDNSDFTFLPGYDPVIGNYIINGRPVMFQVGFNGENITIFSGTSTKPANDILHRTMKMTAFDGMDYLNSFISTGAGPLALLNNGYYANVAAQNIIADLLAEAGFSTSQYVFEQSLQSNIGFLAPVNNTIGALIQKICEAEQALFFFDENGVPQFWNREHIPTNQTVQWSFAYKSILNYQSEDTPIINDVIVQAQPRVVQAKQNIWQLTDPTLVPAAQTSTVITNMVVNPAFQATTGGYYSSPRTINANENVTTAEILNIYEYALYARYQFIEYTQASESVTVSVQFAPFKPQLFETTATYETYSVQVGAGAPFNSALNLVTSDSIVTQEVLFMLNPNYTNVTLVFIDNIRTVELSTVSVVNSLRSPVVQEVVNTDEQFTINSLTVIGWATNNAQILRSIFDSASDSSAGCGLLTVSGGVNSYLFQQFTVATNTQYVAQLQVKGISGVNATAAIIQNGHIVTSASIQLDGSWDSLKIPAFVSENTSTTMQLRIYTDVATTIKVDSVMVQKGVGALTAYFDGSSSPTSSFVFAWTGAANQSTSTATPCGAVLIEADFQDASGELPVTSVTAPTYNNSSLDSTYLTNLNADGSGLNQSGNIILQKKLLNGSKYQMTFINTYSQPIYITQISLYGTPAKITYTISQEYKDPSSIVLFGTNPANNGQSLIIQNDLIQDPSTAQSNAYSLVNDYSKPYQRLIAEVFPNYALQIGDMINATIDDTAQSLNYTIVGITNGVSSNAEPLQTLELEVKNLVSYFTINTSIIGGTDSIAP